MQKTQKPDGKKHQKNQKNKKNKKKVDHDGARALLALRQARHIPAAAPCAPVLPLSQRENPY